MKLPCPITDGPAYPDPGTDCEQCGDSDARDRDWCDLRLCDHCDGELRHEYKIEETA